MLSLLKEKYSDTIKTVICLAALAALAFTVFWAVYKLIDRKKLKNT